MKKRILALMLVLLATLSLAACDGNTKSEGDSGGESQTQAPANNNTGDEESGSTPEGDTGGKMTGSGNLGDYYVEIKEAIIADDYEGNPAIIITYAWTNNSEETTSAAVAVMAKAFQDGIQMESAIIGDSSVYDSMLGFTDVRPGTTIDVQDAFKLTSETSVVEFELTELFSLSDEMVTMDFDPTTLA